MKNFSGLTITGATPDGYSVKANGYVKGSWLQSSVMQNYGSNTGKVCVFDGAGWIYYRTPAEIVAEAGGGGSTEVVQTTGTSTTSVMSQKATTDELAKKANLSGGNDFTGGGQDFILPNGNTFYISDENDTTLVSINKEGFEIDDEGMGTIPILLHNNAGTSGQALTSQGAGKTPIWKELVTLDTGQDITGNKTFTTSQSGGPKIGIYNGQLSIISSSTSEGSISWDTPSDNIAADFSVDENGAHLNLGVDAAADICLDGNAGTAGQVLMSQGANVTPIWSDVTKHGYTELTNENLDTITEAGWYRAAQNNSCTNKPSGIYDYGFILFVEKGTDAHIKQTISYIAYAGNCYYETYSRQSFNAGSTWPVWLLLQPMSDTYPQTFSGRKTFSSGINLKSSLQVNGSNGTSGQVLTSTGSGTPEWKDISGSADAMPTIRLVSIKDTTGTGICGPNNPLRFSFVVEKGTLLDTDVIELCSRTLFTYKGGHDLNYSGGVQDFGRTYKLRAFHQVVVSDLINDQGFYKFEIGGTDNNFSLRQFVRSNMPTPISKSPYSITKYIRIRRVDPNSGVPRYIHSNVIPIYVAPTKPIKDASTNMWSAKIRIR